MRKSMFWVVLCIAMLFVTAPSVSAQDQNQEYKEVLAKMMTLSGAMASTDAMLSQISTMMKQTSPNVPNTYWESFSAKFKEIIGDKLVEMYVPIYQKYLTLDDLKQIVAFYESPIGQKLGVATPLMAVEGMKIGQKLGMEIVTELQNDLKEKGYQ